MAAQALDAALLRQLVTAVHQRASLRVGNAERGDDPGPYAAARAATGAPPLLTRDAARELLDEGALLTVLDGALAQEHLCALRDELSLLEACGRMELTLQAAGGTRSDRVVWLSERDARAHGMPALARAIEALKALVGEHNAARRERAAAATGQQGCFAPPLVVPARVQVALYGGIGGDVDVGYVAHWDTTPLAPSSSSSQAQQQPRYSNRRVLTAVLYACPDDWDAANDGGALRCHVGAPPPTGLAADEQAAIKAAAVTPGGPPWRVVDVAPTGGSCVVFDATALLHQVLPARRARYAVTLWSYAPLE